MWPTALALEALLAAGLESDPRVQRALSALRKHDARRFAEAHLWRFAAFQRAPDGLVPREKHGYCTNDPFALLDLFGRYDHPAAEIAIRRMAPWIVETQNSDGTWGAGDAAAACTAVVISTLRSTMPALVEGTA